MGKQKGMLLSLGTLFFAFVLSTVFFYFVYNFHYDSASDDFTGMVVFGPSYENEQGGQKKENLEILREELETWAAENHAVLFYKGFSAAGIAAVDYAGWFDETLGLSFTGKDPKTALVQGGRGHLGSYIEDDILFPGVFNYQIAGKFDDKNLPTFQGDSFFYYPLIDITEMEGLLFTNVDEEVALDRLGQIIEKSDRSMEFQTYSSAGLNSLNVIIRMVFDDFVSRSMLFTFIGVIFCAVFVVYMMYRESNRYLLIHHLYGATYLSLFIKILIKLIAIALMGTFLGFILGKTQLNLIHQTAYVDIAIFSGICNVIFITLVQVLCFFDWKRMNREQEGAY